MRHIPATELILDGEVISSMGKWISANQQGASRKEAGPQEPDRQMGIAEILG